MGARRTLLQRIMTRGLGRQLDSRRMRWPDPVPMEMAGKYVIWSPDTLTLLAGVDTFDEALEFANREPGRVIQQIPRLGLIRPVMKQDSAKIEG